MNKLLQNAAVIVAGATVVAILAPVLARGVAPAPAPGFAPNDACVGNARLLIKAVIAYAQDNDTKLPPMDTVAHFDAALTHYVPSAAVFACPATHLLYTPNPAIGGHSLLEYRTTAGAVVAFQDAQPHADHQSTVAFLDSHIERGGVEAGDPDKICVDRVKAITLAIVQYAQDNDETFPPMDTTSHVQAVLAPYGVSTRLFTCPATGQPYEFNASLSYVTLGSIISPSTAVLVQDPVAHADGVSTIGYADGHVTHGDASQVYSPNQDVANLRQLGLGILEYTQDSDTKLPPLQNEQRFETVLSPYVRRPSAFVNPLTGMNYALNAALSYVTVTQVSNPAQTWLIRDQGINPDGTFRTLFVDNHVATRAFFVPSHIAVGADNETRLVWSTADGNAGISRLSTSGAELGRKYLGAGLGTVTGMATTPSGTTSILFGLRDISTPSILYGSLNTASMLTLNSGYTQTQLVHYGPYDGWAPSAIAVGGNGLARLLWGRYDHTWALWQDTAAGEYASDVRYGPYANVDGAGLAAGSDNALSVYWKRPSGETVLSRLSPAGVSLTSKTLSAFRSRQPVAITVAPDNSTWILFDRGDGGTEAYAFDAQLAVTGRIELNPEAGWTAKDLGVGADGNVRILSNNQHGDGRLRIVTPAGTIVSTHDYAAF